MLRILLIVCLFTKIDIATGQTPINPEEENMLILLAKIENSQGHTIDSYVEEKVDKDSISLEELQSTAVAGWLMKEFIQDEVYFDKLRATMESIKDKKTKPENSKEYFKELETKYPHFYKYFQIIATFTVGRK